MTPTATKGPDIILKLPEHVYYVDGIIRPSVTGIIKAAGLMDTRFFNDVAAWRGSHTHKATELHDLGILDETTIAPLCVPYFEAYKAFRRDHPHYEPYAIEKRVYCPGPAPYCGTLDRLAWFYGERILLDIKTGPMRLWLTMQLAGYYNALPPAEHKPTVCYGLELRKDGTYHLSEPIHITEREVAAFEALATVHYIRDEYGEVSAA